MNDKIREYDKRIGVPKLKGWQEREILAIHKDDCNCQKCIEAMDDPNETNI